ncbi:hypothetical protein GHT06_009898 [Daphnia sinensis]|uniref:YqaJ viral recombinase domain-containing protein n=1 Tax=Daphnia sinensis TaxID=1820382 RepID=A0AAD5LGQ3_9CRUS|nr:hypothetical protein GHT06_009898 [Daphnia sinensis]
MKMISTTTIPEITLEEISSFHSKLVSQHLPTPITEIFNAAFLNKPFETVLAEIDRLLQTDLFTVTANQSESVQKLTKGQTKAKLWNIYRSGLSTASKSHTICHTNIVKPSTSLLKSICYPADNIFSTEATRYGIENETKCLKKGICWMRERNPHPSFTVTECGLILPTSFLGMAASPDNLFFCECHGRCGVEVKCSWKHRKAASLSRNPYFYQIQQQIIVCDYTYGIFIMFIKKDICVIGIPFDKVVADENISKTHKYMRIVMLPQLLCEHYVKSNNVSELTNQSYLICCQDEKNAIKLLRVVSSCLISTFHKSCVEPPRKRFSNTWMCKTSGWNGPSDRDSLPTPGPSTASSSTEVATPRKQRKPGSEKEKDQSPKSTKSSRYSPNGGRISTRNTGIFRFSYARKKLKRSRTSKCHFI